MPVIRSRNLPCVIFMDDIINYGWEKALILGEIPQCCTGDGSPMQERNLFKHFPVFSEERFYDLIEELIRDGFIVREEG